MTLTIILGYLLVGLIIYPKISRHIYNKFETYIRSGQNYINGRTKKRNDIRDAMWYASMLSVVWPVALYLYYAKYAMFASEIREERRAEVQAQREIDLIRARRIIEESKQAEADNWTSALTNLEKSAKRTAKGLRQG